MVKLLTRAIFDFKGQLAASETIFSVQGINGIISPRCHKPLRSHFNDRKHQNPCWLFPSKTRKRITKEVDLYVFCVRAEALELRRGSAF